MKNTFLVLALTVLLVSTGNVSKAQKGMIIPSNAIGAANFNETFRDNAEINRNEAADLVDAKATQDFKKQFPFITDPAWYKNYDGGFTASFKDNTAQTRVVYDKKGKWNYTISYYNEKAMAPDLWDAVKSVYYSYDILNVSEVHFDNETVYVILLQNQKYLKNIRVHNGEIEEIEHFIRG